jgi:hypothetical protein
MFLFLVDKLGDWLFDELIKPRLPKVAEWVGGHRRLALAALFFTGAFAFIVWKGYPIAKLYWARQGSLAQIQSDQLAAGASSSSNEAMIPTSAGTQTINYTAANLIDGKLETAWQVDNDGIGQSAEISWAKPRRFGKLRVVPGYLKDAPDAWGDRWTLNNRVKEVRVDAYLKIAGPLKWKVWSSGPKTLSDQKVFQSIEMPHWVPATSVRLTILSIYPSERGSPSTGRAIHDTCVSEVELYEWR